MSNENDTLKDIMDTIIDFLKESPVVQKMFKRYHVPIEQIHDINVAFADLPVSAKTRDEEIFINIAFLLDEKFSDQIHYIVHEMCHYLQQNQDDPFDLVPFEQISYLDMPSELEAFAFQVAFMNEFYGEDVATQYVDELLDFHGLEGKEKERRKEFLLIGIE